MTRRGGTGIKATRKPVVVVAGEDRHDRRVLRILLETFCPDMRGRIVEISDSVRLRSASGDRLSQRVRTLARKARAKAQLEDADLACVFIHEDLDGPAFSNYDGVRARVQQALGREFRSVHYVLAAAEVEAWLLLFPAVLTAHVASWRVPRQYRDCDTGRLSDPKRVMLTEVSRSGRTYRESDAPEIVAAAARQQCLTTPTGSNRSWNQLRDDTAACCADHLPTPRRR